MTQLQLATNLANLFGKEVASDYSFESLFDPSHTVLTLDLIFQRSISFEFVLKSKKNNQATSIDSMPPSVINDSVISIHGSESPKAQPEETERQDANEDNSAIKVEGLVFQDIIAYGLFFCLIILICKKYLC